MEFSLVEPSFQWEEQAEAENWSPDDKGYKNRESIVLDCVRAECRDCHWIREESDAVRLRVMNWYLKAFFSSLGIYYENKTALRFL